MNCYLIANLLAKHSFIYIIATSNNDKLQEYKHLLENKKVINITKLAAILAINKADLESIEKEKNYGAIAKGKVAVIQKAMRNYLYWLTTNQLNQFLIIGDDYGAAFDAIPFTYTTNLTCDQLFSITYDENNHIDIIYTSQKKLANKAAPNYLSHRIIDSIGQHYQLSSRLEAFEKFAFELLHHANRNNKFNAYATVAMAFATGLNSIRCYSKTMSYPLIKTIADRHPTGFEFDRIQQLSVDRGTIASLSMNEKALLLRGPLLNRLLANFVSEKK
jgi:hypothetical protein